MAKIEGTGIREPVYEVTEDLNGVRVRVTDNHDQKIWFTVFLSWQELGACSRRQQRREELARALLAPPSAADGAIPLDIDLSAQPPPDWAFLPDPPELPPPDEK